MTTTLSCFFMAKITENSFLGPTPPNVNWKLLSTKKLTEAELETSMKSVSILYVRKMFWSFFHRKKSFLIAMLLILEDLGNEVLDILLHTHKIVNIMFAEVRSYD